LAVSLFCRTLSSVYYVSASSTVSGHSISDLPLKGAPLTPSTAIAANAALNMPIIS
jgi:hypothetical protein